MEAMTPDAFKGDVTDPMSQWGYLWDGNNPVANGDPSGFAPTLQGILIGIGVGLAAAVVVVALAALLAVSIPADIVGALIAICAISLEAVIDLAGVDAVVSAEYLEGVPTVYRMVEALKVVKIPIPWVPVVRVVQTVVAVIAGDTAEGIIDQTDVYDVSIVPGEVLKWYTLQGRAILTNNSTVDVTYDGVTVPSGQVSEFIRQTSDGVDVGFLQRGNDLTVFGGSDGLDFCYSCSWSGQLGL
jgi:hypothetical protein